MDKQIKKLNKKAAEILGDNADYIIIAHKNGQCGGAARGDISNIAQAFSHCYIRITENWPRPFTVSSSSMP